MGRSAEAVAAQYDAGLAAQPDRWQSLRQQWHASRRDGQDGGGSIAQYQQAIRYIPDYAQLRYNLGSLLLDVA